MAAPMSYDAARFTGIESTPKPTAMPARRISPPTRRPQQRSTSLEPAKLQKATNHNAAHVRAVSGQYASSGRQDLRLQVTQDRLDVPASTSAMGAAISSPIKALPATPSSAKVSSRPTTPVYSIAKERPHTPQSSSTSGSNKLEKKHGWFGKKKDKHDQHAPIAWIAGHQGKPAYDIESVMLGRPANDLWDHAYGDCFIHLFPKNYGKAASFKIDSRAFASSPILVSNITTEGSEKHLYLQLKLTHAAVTHGDPSTTADPTPEDLQSIVDFRNLFAFLCGGSLTATDKRSSLFSIFLAVGSLLSVYRFSNADGTTFGEIADGSFNKYVDELGMADVRTSREKTIEGIVLGERMRCVPLYSEAFTHAVGKLDDIVALNSVKYDMITQASKMRLTRASLDLSKREHAVQLTLKDFDFPSIFSGIMNSKTAEERKEGVRFDAWKEAFLNTRKWMLATLKQQYGDWPPKAKSKKNDLEVSGLQRQVLKQLYADVCAMYDLLVDRTQLTTRTVDGIDRAGPVEAPWMRALRSILSEYDRSSPPVKPPVPFDLPKMPSVAATGRDTGKSLNPEKLAARKLKDEELKEVLRASWNEDATITPFVNAFREMERRAAHGCTIQEIVDLRTGQWIFMYAVMQALPMLACDAPGLKFKKGVEYFLCAPPRDGMPWVDSIKSANRRTWFTVGEVGSVVSLPSHVIEHSTEGIYRRSHCWVKATEWAKNNPLLTAALQEQATATDPNSATAGLSPPGVVGRRSRSASPRNYRNSSLNLGLEALAVAPSIKSAVGTVSPVPVHKVDSAKTFDSILAGMSNGNTKKK